MTGAERKALESVIWDLWSHVPKMRLLAADMKELGYLGWAVDLNRQASFWERVADSMARDLVPA